MRRRASLLGALALVAGCGEASPSAASAPAADAGPRELDPPDARAPDAGAPAPDAAPPPNRPPRIEALEADPAAGLSPLRVRLSWSAADPDGDALRCALRLAETSTTVDCARGEVRLTLEGDRRARAELTVSDPAGAAATAALSVDVFAPFELPPGARGPWELAGAPVDPDRLGCEVRGDALPQRLDEALPARMRAARPPDAEGPCRFVLPAGTFTLGGPLRLPSGWFLVGAGAERTRLRVDMGGRARPAITLAGQADAVFTSPAQGRKGERALTVRGELALPPGAPTELIAWISAENDPARLPPRWARPYSDRAVGQLLRVVALEASRIRVDRPLAEDHRADGPYPSRVELLDASAFAVGGVMDLGVERLDDAHAPIIHLERTLGAVVRRVDSRRTGWAHVAVDRSLACAVSRSAFRGAHGHGGGGRGYGVDLRFHTTGCLVEDNVFDDLRHALIVQLGANQNVFGYNHSTNSHDELGLPKADLSTHGHYAHLNLFEGNVVERAHIADWWGPTPDHVLWSNRITQAGVEVGDGTEGVVLVDNVVRGGLTIDPAIRSLTCAGNTAADGAPLDGGHPACGAALNAPDAPFPPRAASLYRQAPLRTESGELPAAARARSGRPVPPPP